MEKNLSGGDAMMESQTWIWIIQSIGFRWSLLAVVLGFTRDEVDVTGAGERPEKRTY